jgi:metal-responsive CopG/Arc/MetJ family transcriptional regulator
MATLDSIADEIGYSRNELMQSMVKFGLTNRDWRNEGLTAHKRLPRYEENPMATKPPSPAQLAARARFAEMARSGSLNRKRQIAAKKRAANPSTVHKPVASKGFISYRYKGPYGYIMIGATDDDDALKEARRSSSKPVTIENLEIWDGKKYVPVFKNNPRKKTVSQKISQLVHEGYPQRQAVAVALNEQRAGKVKRNPASGMVNGYAIVCMHPEPHTVAITMSMYEAKQIAQDYATRENVQVAIKPIKVHAAHFA